MKANYKCKKCNIVEERNINEKKKVCKKCNTEMVRLFDNVNIIIPKKFRAV